MNDDLIEEQEKFLESNSKLIIVNGPNRSGKTKVAVERMCKLSNEGEWTLYLTSSSIIKQHVFDYLYQKQFIKGHIKKYVVANIDNFLLNYIYNNTDYKKENIIMRDNYKLIEIISKTKTKINYIEAVERFKEILNNNLRTVDEYLNYKTNNISDDDKKEIFNLLNFCRTKLKKENKKILEDIFIELLYSYKKIDTKYIDGKIKINNFKHIILDRADCVDNLRYKILKKVFNSLKEKNKDYSISLICDTFDNDCKNNFVTEEKIIKFIEDESIEYIEFFNYLGINRNLVFEELQNKKIRDKYEPEMKKHSENKKIIRSVFYPDYDEFNVLKPYVINYNNFANEIHGTSIIIKSLINIGYTLNDMRIISFTNEKLEKIKGFLENKYEINVKYKNQYKNNSANKKRNILGGSIELITAFEAEYAKEKDIVFILETDSIMDLRKDLNDDEAEDYYKKIKLICNSLETSKDLIFITKGLNNKYIKQFKQEYIKEIYTIKEIEEISGNYTYEDIHTKKENCDKMKFETYTDNEINNCDTYWSDDNVYSYNDEDYLQNYIDESFDGDEEEWEDYCEDIAERYD